MNQHGNNIIKLIEKLGYRHATWQVFSDFVEMAAISISNAVDWTQREEREKKYLEVVSRYEKKELDLFPEMLGELVMGLEEEAAGGGPEAFQSGNFYRNPFNAHTAFYYGFPGKHP
jgi:hypothetical protein